jgi:Methyltransferase domain
MSNENFHSELETLLIECEQSFAAGLLQRLVLSKYKGADADLERITIRPLQIKDQQLLSFRFEYKTNHITKNKTIDEAIGVLKTLIGNDFHNAHLITHEWEHQVSVSKKGKWLVNRTRNKNQVNTSEMADSPPHEHNRQKIRFVEQNRPYLKELGITDANALVIPAMSRKWKQINKFIEVLSTAIQQTGLDQSRQLHVADFGSGKAYLTFAVHDYVNTHLGVKTQVTGVELRQNLVDLCNKTAKKLSLEGIKFEQGDVQHFSAQNINIMIALHACDIATDYALHMGIRTGAEIIMCSPCCHKQIRPQLKSPPLLAPLLQYGIHLGQEAEMITDSLRALLLEANGYDTKVFEFISMEHTSKNKMILAQKRKSPRDNSAVLKQIADIKRFYGIDEQCLESLLAATA